MSFKIDPALLQNSEPFFSTRLTQFLWVNDQRVPCWLMLVPKRLQVSELFELPALEQSQLCFELSLSAEIIKKLYQADKINIGLIGNIVPQCHAHVVARRKSDPLWPKPIWGQGQISAYPAQNVPAILAQLRAEFARHHFER